MKWLKGDSTREHTSGYREAGEDPTFIQESDSDLETTIRDLKKSVRELLRREERMSQRVHAFESELVAEIALLSDRLRTLEAVTEAIERRQDSSDRRL